MEKAGLIEEMVSDAFESAMDEEDLEEETEAEVQKVMAEIAGEIQSLPAAKRPVIHPLVHHELPNWVLVRAGRCGSRARAGRGSGGRSGSGGTQESTGRHSKLNSVH